MKIVIPTCDKYARTILAHVHYLRKFWPQCPYEIIVVVGGKATLDDVDATVITLGKDYGYANNLHAFFGKYVRDELMMLCLDDLIPVEVHRKRIERSIAAIEKDRNIVMIRLSRRFSTPGTPYEKDAFFIEMNKENPHLFSQKGTIWRVANFRALLWRGSTPWGAEELGGRKARRMPGLFLGVSKETLTQRNWFVHRKRDRKTTEWIQSNW